MLIVSLRALSLAAIRSAWGSNSCIIARPPAVAAPTLPVPPPALQEPVERSIENGTRRRSPTIGIDHRADSRDPRPLAYQAAPLLSRLWRGQVAAQSLGTLLSVALPFRLAGTGELRIALCAWLPFRRCAQDDRREHRRGGRAEGDPGAGSRAARPQRADLAVLPRRRVEQR